MTPQKLLVLFVLTFCFLVSNGFAWFFSRSSGSEEEVDAVPESVKNKPTQFELKTMDDGFLSEAKFTEKLSPLDLCHHQVVASLKSSCSRLSEEGLGKFAVRLYNCQAETEERQTFDCTDDMSLADCTRNMDPTIWNAYQIVSNRARAICYATRQQQFRLKTEYTVNNLLSTTQEQMEAMKLLKEGQSNLAQHTEDTISNIKDSQKSLIEQHMAIKNAQSNVHHQLASNLKDLTREKALIASGNKQLMELTGRLNDKLDSFVRELLTTEDKHKDNQKDIIKALGDIKVQAGDVWKKFDEDSHRLLKMNEQNTEYFEETLEKLQKINDSVTFVLNTMSSFLSNMDSKLGWIAQFIGFTGSKMDLLHISVIHCLYFVGFSAVASILRLPLITKFLIWILAPTNAYLTLNEETGLEPFSIGIVFITLITTSLVVQFFMRIFRSRRRHKKAATIEGPKEVEYENDNISKLNDLLQRMNPKDLEPILRKYSYVSSSADEQPCDPPNTPATPGRFSTARRGSFNSPKTPTTPLSPRDVMSRYSFANSAKNLNNTTFNGVPGSPLADISTLTNRARTPTRPICIGLTAMKQPCKKTSAKGSEYCVQHMSQANIKSPPKSNIVATGDFKENLIKRRSSRSISVFTEPNDSDSSESSI